MKEKDEREKTDNNEKYKYPEGESLEEDMKDEATRGDEAFSSGRYVRGFGNIIIIYGMRIDFYCTKRALLHLGKDS